MKRFFFKTPYGSSLVSVVRRRYVNGNLRMELLDMEGFPYAVASVNVPHIKLNMDEIVVKDYSENEGMYDFLISNGIATDTKRSVRLSDHVLAPIVLINPEGRWKNLSEQEIERYRQMAA